MLKKIVIGLLIANIIVWGVLVVEVFAQIKTTGQVKFTQEILPAPPTRKATVIDVQPTAVKEVVQNTARP